MIEVSTSDIDFYEGKIKNLEEDNFYMHDEIIKLRTRLRTAEDFEIKYSLLISANQREMEKLKTNLERQEEARTKELLNAKLKENDQYWLARLQDSEAQIKAEAEANIEVLRKDLIATSQQLSDIKVKSEEAELFGFRVNKLEKENQNLRSEIEEMKIFYEKQRSEEITAIRTNLGNNYREKIENEQRKNEAKVASMQAKLHELELRDDNTTYKASETTNRELIALKALFQEKSDQYARELQQAHNLLAQKNEQISNILKERVETEEKQRLQGHEKNEYIKELEDSLLEREKQHEIELLNQLERARTARDQEKDELLLDIEHLKAELSRLQQLWNEKILHHENEKEELNNKFEDEKRRLADEKNMNKRKVSELSLRIKEAEGEREVGETEMLINSLRDLDVKGDQLGNYENGITFLERLNKKCQMKLEEKSRTVSKLYKDINDVRVEAEREISELKEKVRRDRKENGDRIQALEAEVRDLSDRLRNREREYRQREREYQKEKTELEEQRNAFKELNEELQRDYNRVVEGKKGAEASYREERQKSFASKTDVNLIKKQKWLELEKQKNELHIIFKEKEEQIKLGFEQPMDDLKNELNKLRQDFEMAKQEREQLRRENQQLWEQVEANKQNDKMAEYNKKLASLNLQFALTQNIYESLKKAKSRIDPSFSPAELSDFDSKA